MVSLNWESCSNLSFINSLIHSNDTLFHVSTSRVVPRFFIPPIEPILFASRGEQHVSSWIPKGLSEYAYLQAWKAFSTVGKVYPVTYELKKSLGIRKPRGRSWKLER